MLRFMSPLRAPRLPFRAALLLMLGAPVLPFVLPGCAGGPAGAVAGDPATVKEAFGVRCDAVRAQEAPDLMAWDPAARANLDRLRKAGVVAVRYEAKGCDVKLELLPNCKGPSSYKYSGYAARETKTAKDATEVFASLPLGAQSIAGKVSKGKMLRTDYILVGTDSLKADARIARASLRGPDCARATHVVSTVYVGGFAMEAGTSAELGATVSVFGVGAGASQARSSERLAREGDATACEDALKSGKETSLCAVPLRVGLLALDGLASDGSGVAAASAATGAAPTSCPDGMVGIEGGSFTMGAAKTREDVAPFCIDRTEITAQDYAGCVAKGLCRAPIESTKPLCTFRQAGKETHPINCVSYDEAKAHCQARGALLPTEQQWEWAARGNAQRTYPWGEEADLSRACANRGREGGTCSVTEHPTGATPAGVLGLAGNVAEWVELRTGNAGNAGGDYSDKAPRDLEPRRRNYSDKALPTLGFRCVTRP